MGNCNTKKYDSNKPNLLSESTPKGSVIHEGSILGLKCFNGVIGTASDDKRVAILEREQLIQQAQYKPLYLSGHTKAVNRLAFLNSSLWSISRDLSIRQWNVESGECKQTWSDAHTLNIAAIASSPFDTQHIFTGSRDYVVKGWDIESGKPYSEFKAPRNIVTSMICNQSSESSLVYQGSEDLCIRVWDARQSGSMPAIHITGFVYFPLCMDLHHDSNYLAAGCKGFDNTGCEVKLIDLRNTAKFLGEYKGHSHDVTGVKFSTLAGSDDDVLISSSKDGSIYVRDNKRTNKEEDCVLTSHLTGKNLTSLDVIPGGTANQSRHGFAVGATDGSLMLMSFSTQSNHIKVDFATSEFFDAAGDTNAE